MASLEDLAKFARSTLTQYGLTDWKFSWNSAESQFGVCDFGKKEIRVSRVLASMNPESETLDTILHEVAHALAGPRAGHGPEWTRACRTVGAKPERCYDSKAVVSPPKRWLGSCKVHGDVAERRELGQRSREDLACGKCCKENGGWSKEFLLTWKDRRA